MIVRVFDTAVDPAEITEAIELFRAQVKPTLESSEGCAGIEMMVGVEERSGRPGGHPRHLPVGVPRGDRAVYRHPRLRSGDAGPQKAVPEDPDRPPLRTARLAEQAEAGAISGR